MTEQTTTTDMTPADAPSPAGRWWLRPQWWPMLALLPMLGLGGVVYFAARGMPLPEERLPFVIKGLQAFPAGTLLCVGLLAMISERWYGGAKRTLALITSAVVMVGSAIWFMATFKTITARPTLVWVWTPEPYASGSLGTQLCFIWGVCLFFIAVWLGISAARKSGAARASAAATSGAGGTMPTSSTSKTSGG